MATGQCLKWRRRWLNQLLRFIIEYNFPPSTLMAPSAGGGGGEEEAASDKNWELTLVI